MRIDDDHLDIPSGIIVSYVCIRTTPLDDIDMKKFELALQGRKKTARMG